MSAGTSGVATFGQHANSPQLSKRQREMARFQFDDGVPNQGGDGCAILPWAEQAQAVGLDTRTECSPQITVFVSLASAPTSKSVVLCTYQSKLVPPVNVSLTPSFWTVVALI